MDAGRSVVAYVAVGSNVEPQVNIPAALELLRRQVAVCGVSTFYRTPAVGPDGAPRPGQDEFLNGVFEIRTDLSPRALKHGVLRDIERRLGRVRTPDRYAPRTIDLDVVLYGDEVIDEPDLKVPAADIARPFVAVPLLELAPELVVPGTHEPLACLWAAAGPCGMAVEPECTRLLKEMRRK